MGVGVRTSAPMRRGAAPYADGREQVSEHSHSISLLLFAVRYRYRSVLGLSSRLTLHDFACVTMAQKVPSSTLDYRCYRKPSFSKGFGSHMPVAPDPPS